MTALSLVPEEREPIGPSAALAYDQMQETLDALRRPASEYWRAPWGALDAMLGGIPQGQLWYVGAFSGQGKTTALTSLAISCMKERNEKIAYLGLESKPNVIRTHFACKTLGYDAGDFLTGEYLKWPNAKDARAEVMTVVQEMGMQSWQSLHISGVRAIGEEVLWAEMSAAAEWGATLFIVDHVDHLQDAGARDSWHESVAVNRRLLDGAQELGLRILAATQYNNEVVKGNRLGLHTYPMPHYIQHGGHKRQIADGMIGLARPLKFSIDKETLTRYRNKEIGQNEVCEPNTMAVYCLKHRAYGNREGDRVYLRVDKGRVYDADQEHYRAGAVHGIRSSGSRI